MTPQWTDAGLARLLNHVKENGMEHQSNIAGRVRKIIAEQFAIDDAELTNDNRIVDDFGADSLDTIELVMTIEDEFGMEVPDEDAEKIQTVQQAIDYVAMRVGGAA